MPIIRFQSRQWADPPAASCRCYIHPPARRRYQIPIAPAAPLMPNFPRLRALALFGRRPPQGVEGFVIPASKNLHNKRHHSITSSARPSSIAGISRPSAFRSLEIDTQLEFGRLVKRDISRIGTPKNLIDEVGEAAIDFRLVNRISHQSANFDEFAERINCGNPAFSPPIRQSSCDR
jgi:hypothetical protein